MAFVNFQKQSESLISTLLYNKLSCKHIIIFKIISNNYYTKMNNSFYLLNHIISVTGYATGPLSTSVEVTTESS